ncbi:hypothetical protein [Phenylobacterium sp.]|uniref:hypothetical protein n=1 Tax=Phenylobacterium sp. TaxID=1871053 RepID=UPI00121AA8C5|nr:hypothetical protein [Phenylobacterium sp.]THD65047.1 MAG: hypothetical protein E8A49_00620 [Phenylobacterium sp.]
MSHAADKQARAEAILGELAELGLMLARDLAAQARAAEDPETQVALVGAFQKTSRTVRLTLALDFKLQRDAARAAREDAAAAAEHARQGRLAALIPARGPCEARKGRVRNLLNRLIWNEAEGDADEYEVLLDDLTARLDEAAEAEGFEDTPVETLARRIAADMGLSGELVLTAPPPSTRPAMADTG